MYVLYMYVCMYMCMYYVCMYVCMPMYKYSAGQAPCIMSYNNTLFDVLSSITNT